MIPEPRSMMLLGSGVDAPPLVPGIVNDSEGMLPTLFSEA
jgi:hypothetical protein